MSNLSLSTADHQQSPPVITIPRVYNAAYDLIERNLIAGRGEKTAYIDYLGSYSYTDLEQHSSRFANLLGKIGLRREERVLMCLLDTFDYPCAFLGAIKAGIVPVAVNTLLTAKDYEYMVRDSGARNVFVSPALADFFTPLVSQIDTLENVLIVSSEKGQAPEFEALVSQCKSSYDAVETCADAACFWLYSSGSTGNPKGTVHQHSSLIHTAELYGRGVLGMTSNDVIFSAAKLFFAYGLGNALTLPLSVGATVVLMADRPTPDGVYDHLLKHQPTLFFGVPTLYAAMLAATNKPMADTLSLRACVSAGEALPASIYQRWQEQFNVPIYDGIGSTEMLHIFISNSPDNITLGTTGKPVPGYQIRLIDELGAEITSTNTIGDMQVKGPTSAIHYWHNTEKSQTTFLGQWTNSGDKYAIDEEGNYAYAGRSDDMLKVSGIYVSPIEVEACLSDHPAIFEAAVVGQEDDNKLTKPAAYVVLGANFEASEELTNELQNHVKDNLAKHKYPRWIYYLDELPKTATGKIQRFKLRG